MEDKNLLSSSEAKTEESLSENKTQSSEKSVIKNMYMVEMVRGMEDVDKTKYENPVNENKKFLIFETFRKLA